MSKSVEKHAKRGRRGGKSAQTRRQATCKGSLIAIDSCRGRGLEHAAQRVLRACAHKGQGGVSLWDASNTFHELRLVKSRYINPTPRTLLLLYASDLLFRLRWEIRPALEQGSTVIAAPYVHSAIAFGRAASLPQAWLEELFSFAPAPDACFWTGRKREKKSNGKGTSSFIEFGCGVLASGSPFWDAEELHSAIQEYFEKLQEHSGVRRLSKKAMQQLR